MKVYAHCPYDVDESRLDEAIGLMRLLQAEGIVIASHEPSTAYERLLLALPPMDWVVRVKGSRAWWPSNLNSVEWPGERSAMETVRWLLNQGIRPLVVLWNEPDTELPDPWKADDPDERQRWIGFYRDAAERARVQLRLAFGSSVDIALAPLSQGGPPDRFTDWVTGLTDLYPQMDVLSEHSYTDGRSYTDPEWGGRYLRWAEWANGMPLLITETNDNGAFFAQAPEERAQDYADYAASVAASGKVAALAEFILPGSRRDFENPAWWTLTPEICTGVRKAIDLTAPPEPPQVMLDPPITFIPTEEPTMPEFQLGFKAKADELGGQVVGDPLEDQDYLPLTNGGEITFQTTTKGLMVYSKAANKVHFLTAR